MSEQSSQSPPSLSTAPENLGTIPVLDPIASGNFLAASGASEGKGYEEAVRQAVGVKVGPLALNESGVFIVTRNANGDTTVFAGYVDATENDWGTHFTKANAERRGLPNYTDAQELVNHAVPSTESKPTDRDRAAAARAMLAELRKARGAPQKEAGAESAETQDRAASVRRAEDMIRAARNNPTQAETVLRKALDTELTALQKRAAQGGEQDWTGAFMYSGALKAKDGTETVLTRLGDSNEQSVARDTIDRIAGLNLEQIAKDVMVIVHNPPQDMTPKSVLMVTAWAAGKLLRGDGSPQDVYRNTDIAQLLTHLTKK